MTTLLDICNDMLLDVGADTVSTVVDNRQGQLAARCFRDAVRDVCSHHQWHWMKSIITASSWSNELATLPTSVVQVTMVQVANFPVEYIDDHALYGNHRALTSYGYATGRPLWYTRAGENTYAFEPYPTTDATKAAVKFHVRSVPSVTLADSFEPAVPVFVEQLMRYYASSLLSQKLLGEDGPAQTYMQLYTQNLTQYRARYATENAVNQDAIA